MPEARRKPFLGILMLDTRFPRILGDAGNVDSYDMPARTLVVGGIGSVDIVQDRMPEPKLVSAFCKAAKQLEAEGASAIISTCGFLVSVQDRISKTVDIPVMLSALTLYAKIRTDFVGKPIAILTASKKSLGSIALKAAGINPKDTCIAGLEDCAEFSNAFLQTKAKQSQSINQNKIETAVVDKARQLLEKNPEIAAFLLECGNLPPYARAISAATKRPVYSILDGAKHLMRGF